MNQIIIERASNANEALDIRIGGPCSIRQAITPWLYRARKCAANHCDKTNWQIRKCYFKISSLSRILDPHVDVHDVRGNTCDRKPTTTTVMKPTVPHTDVVAVAVELGDCIPWQSKTTS